MKLAEEINPFVAFVPPDMRLFIVGSFPGKEQTQGADVSDQWFYGARRNQLWKILSIVFETPLETTAQKRDLFTREGIGMGDILLKIRRKADTNLDQNLEILQYNNEALGAILKSHPDTPFYFTSRFVEKHFRKCFPGEKRGVCLPSPSPRYAQLSLEEKAKRYRVLLRSDH